MKVVTKEKKQATDTGNVGPRIISVSNSKGGVGKSVITILLATALAKDKNKKVLIIDCDSQGSVTDMYNREMSFQEGDPAIEVEELAPRKVQTFIRRFGNDYDIIFIDVPRMTDGRKDQSTVMLLYNCDAILVPVIGSEVDVLSSLDFLSLVEQAAKEKEEMGESIDYYGFINRRNQRKSNRQAQEQMQKSGLNMFKNSLSDLSIFTNPSFYKSIMASAEGERRFGEFFKEFKLKFNL